MSFLKFTFLPALAILKPLPFPGSVIITLFAIQSNELMLNKWDAQRKGIKIMTENLPQQTQTLAEVMTLWKYICRSREKNRILGKWKRNPTLHDNPDLCKMHQWIITVVNLYWMSTNRKTRALPLIRCCHIRLQRLCFVFPPVVTTYSPKDWAKIPFPVWTGAAADWLHRQ